MPIKSKYNDFFLIAIPRHIQKSEKQSNNRVGPKPNPNIACNKKNRTIFGYALDIQEKGSKENAKHKTWGKKNRHKKIKTRVTPAVKERIRRHKNNSEQQQKKLSASTCLQDPRRSKLATPKDLENNKANIRACNL